MWTSVLLVWHGVLVSVLVVAAVAGCALVVVLPYLALRRLLPWPMPSGAWVTALVQGMSWAEICATWPTVQPLLLEDLAMAWGLIVFALAFALGLVVLLAPLLACCRGADGRKAR
jgi:hypothetical protein